MVSEMKICVLTTVHDYDDNRVFYKEILSLAKKGHEITYVASNIPNNFIMKYEFIKMLSIEKPKRMFKRLLQQKTLFKKLLNIDFDILLFHDVELIQLAYRLKQKKKIGVIYDIHEDTRNQIYNKFYLNSFLKRFFSKIVVYFENKADSYFDGIICADNFIVDYYKNENIEIVYNFPDINSLQPPVIKNIEPQFDFIFPGSMSKKTIMYILNLVKMCNAEGRNPKTLIISPFNFEGRKEWVKDQINILGLDINNFLLLNKISPLQVPEYLQDSKIGLLLLPDNPKLRKNIPTKLFEYMFYKLPVLAYRLPPSYQFMENSFIGYSVVHGQDELLVKYALELIDNPQKRLTMGENGHYLVVTKYNWANEAEKLNRMFLKIYEKRCKK